MVEFGSWFWCLGRSVFEGSCEWFNTGGFFEVFLQEREFIFFSVGLIELSFMIWFSIIKERLIGISFKRFFPLPGATPRPQNTDPPEKTVPAVFSSRRPRRKISASTLTTISLRRR